MEPSDRGRLAEADLEVLLRNFSFVCVFPAVFVLERRVVDLPLELVAVVCSEGAVLPLSSGAGCSQSGVLSLSPSLWTDTVIS